MKLVFKNIAGGTGMDFVLSDETVDRDGDVILASGWDLRNFKKNPIALFGHSSSFPIGTWTNIRVVGKQLIATLAMASRGTSARIDELISLVEQGILRAVSVGFNPIQQEPIDPKQPYGGQRYTKQELLETSLCSVPVNPGALQLAKSLNISDETLALAFGEQANTTRRDLSTNGEHAQTTARDFARTRVDRSSQNKDNPMKTLAERILALQDELNGKKDKLAELVGAETLDADAVEEINVQIESSERNLAALKSSEAKIGVAAVAKAGTTLPPGTVRRPLGQGQKEVSGFDLLVRATLVQGIAHVNKEPVEKVLEDRYPGHEATAIITKADQTIGTTTVAGWASELVQTVNQGFVEALIPYSIYPALRAKGVGLNFDGIGTINLPGRSAGGAGGGFVGEGAPIRVGRITTLNRSLTPKKMGVIVPFSRELAKRSTPAIEALVRQSILEDTAQVLDPILLDANVGTTVRPAGLLYGVSAAASAYGGNDYLAIIADFKALLAPFFAANAADNITVLMNPSQGLAIALTLAPDGSSSWFDKIKERITIIESTNVTAGTLIALRNSDFATANGDAPEFDVSEQATIHMEDATPLEIVSGTGPTTADPIRSLWQTASIAVRMLMDIGWVMRRAGMVQFISGVQW